MGAPPVGRGNLAAERMAAIKAQQEAFSKKGQKTEGVAPPVGRGNLAAERMAAIKAQQEAFSKKGQKAEEDEPDESQPESGIKAVASNFGDLTKPKSAVQKRMEAFEKKQKEEAMKNDHTAFQEVKWMTGQR